MGIKKIVIMNTVCTLLFSVMYVDMGWAAAASYPLPWIKKDCDICHLPAGTHKPGELKKQLSDLCLDCHRDRKAPAEHKVDIAPKSEVKGLPLFEGKIACPTCHDPHSNVNGKMLRLPAKQLCLVCHAK